MSKITNDGLTQSGTILYSCTHMATVGVKEQTFQCTPISLWWQNSSHVLMCVCRSWISGTRLWSVWWRTSVRRSSTHKSFLTFSSSVRTRSRRASRLASTQRCRAGSRRWCSTRRRSSEDWACCRWVTCWSHSPTSGGRSRPTSASHTSGLGWVTRKISWSRTCTGETRRHLPVYHSEIKHLVWLKAWHGFLCMTSAYHRSWN